MTRHSGKLFQAKVHRVKVCEGGKEEKQNNTDTSAAHYVPRTWRHSINFGSIAQEQYPRVAQFHLFLIALDVTYFKGNSN